ncbi:MAG: crossover junction endodeoxyribonuclease RuvC [bacterium]|nr:crossover junction endodeoxyribonuclease RuvC [bacterium]
MAPPADSNRPGGVLRVLGIDPGLADVGWGLIDWRERDRRASLVDYGVIRTPAGAPLPRRLDLIYTGLTQLIERTRPAVAAVEELFFAKNVKTAMVVAHGRAACLLATAREGLELAEYTPLQIKQALTGHGRAAKLQVQLMVRAVLGLAEVPRPDHAADALAAALCHAHSLGMNEKVARARAATGADGNPLEDPRKLLLASMRHSRGRRR